MKKIIIVSGMLCLLACTPAKAQISIQAFFAEPEPAYVEAPVYASPYPVYPSYVVEPSWHHERYVSYDHHVHRRMIHPRPMEHHEGPHGHDDRHEDSR